MRRVWCVLLLLLALPAAPAWAAVSCTASAPDMDFGTISAVPLPLTDVTPSLTINCTGGTSGATVRVCVGINAGTGTGSGGGARYMNSGANTVQYQIYSDSARSTVWGDSTSGGMYEPMPSVVLGAGGSGSQAYPIYGRILNPPAQSVPVGTYSSGLQFTIKFPAGGSPCTAGSGSVSSSGSFNARVGVAASCTVTAADVNFGSYASLASAVTGAGSLSVTCSPGRPYTIALNAGSTSGNTIAARSMSLNGVGLGVVSYQLYRDAGPANVWGDGAVGVVYSGTGTGTAQSVPVYGLVPAQATPVPGTYLDTVRATVTY